MSKNNPTPSSGTTGVEYLDVKAWANLEVTAEKLYNLRGNAYAAGLSNKRQTLILSTIDGKPWPIEVLDKENEPVEELQTTLEGMFYSKKVDLWSKLAMALDDTDWYGYGFYNPVWDPTPGSVEIEQLRHLPAYTFDTLPSGRKRYSNILSGVTKDDQGNIEYWQRTDSKKSTPEKLDANLIFPVKNPACSELAGDPFLRPLYPFFNMVEYCWNGQMQLADRLGVPPIFPKLTGPADPPSDANDNVGDLEYMENLGMYYGKNKVYPLREKMTIETLNITDSDILGRILSLLHDVIVEYATPSSWVSKDGTLIGGSDKSAGNLMNMYINGTRTWLANSFNPLLQEYLVLEKYEGYKAYFKVPLLTDDQADVRIREAQVGYLTGTLDFNEIRKRLSAEGLSEESINIILSFWKENKPQQAPGVSGFTTSMVVPIGNAPTPTVSGASGKLVDDTYDQLSKLLDPLEDDIMKALDAEANGEGKLGDTGDKS